MFYNKPYNFAHSVAEPAAAKNGFSPSVTDGTLATYKRGGGIPTLSRASDPAGLKVSRVYNGYSKANKPPSESF